MMIEAMIDNIVVEDQELDRTKEETTTINQDTKNMMKRTVVNLMELTTAETKIEINTKMVATVRLDMKGIEVEIITAEMIGAEEAIMVPKT